MDAHEIAANWHGGQPSYLYSFASTGKIVDHDETVAEIVQTMKEVRETRYQDPTDAAANLVELAYLWGYVDGTRPVI